MRCEVLGSMCCERRERGFALITAMIAAIIMLALGILVIQLSTQDLKSGAATVGEKKALSAADTGIHQLMRNFPPSNEGTEIPVDETNAPGDSYIYSQVPKEGLPDSVSMPGYSIGGGKTWGMDCSSYEVTGKNKNYKTEVTIAVGLGYGPSPIGTTYE
jgi:type II secretory pathway pseudopilin PulG